MVSTFFLKFIEERLGDLKKRDGCIQDIETAFLLSTHLVRARSVARSAGFCSYYGRMAEKMGVYETCETPSVTKGREVHKILSIVSLRLFLDNPAPRPEDADKLANEYVKIGTDELADSFTISNDQVKLAQKLLTRLIRVLPKAKKLLNLDQDNLFPLVEQTLIDYKTRMYGTPDLILESENNQKAIVIEWKTYTLNSRTSSPSDFEKAQVLAYSIMEARRLGINKLNDIFESIAGISSGAAKKISKHLRGETLDKREVAAILDEIKLSKSIKILPLIVTPSGSYPPHPLMYTDKKTVEYDTKTLFERYKKLYDLFIGVVVGSEHLALQIMNVPKLLGAVKGDVPKVEVLKALREKCSDRDGYLVYGYTPFKYLKKGKPGQWDQYPCVLCPFRGDDGPCKFYFGETKPKDYFDKLMWWARYTIYWRRERDLVNHRAIYELFNDQEMRSFILSSDKPREFEVDFSRVGKARIVLRKGDRVIHIVKVKRGLEDLGKFRLDVFNISNVDFSEEDDVIELRRNLREVELDKAIVGCLRKTLYLTIIDPEHVVNPLMSISTFVMIDDSHLEDDTLVYRCYPPSSVLVNSLRIFGKYVEMFKSKKPKMIVLAYETPVDLTIMELRAVDSIHRYLKSIVSHDSNKQRKDVDKINEIIRELSSESLKIEDLIKEHAILKKTIRRTESGSISDSTVVGKIYELLCKRILGEENEGKDNA